MAQIRRHLPHHLSVEGLETATQIAEKCAEVANALLICDDIIVQSKETLNRSRQKVTVAKNRAHRVVI